MYATTDEIIRAVRDWQEASRKRTAAWREGKGMLITRIALERVERCERRLRALRLPPVEEARRD